MRYSSFDIGRAVVAPVIWREQKRKLSLLVPTHADMDHIGGIPGIYGRFSTAILADSGMLLGYTKEYERVREEAISDGKYKKLLAGEKLEFPGAVTVEVLNPPNGKLPYPDTRNNRSLVLKVVYGKIKILLTGDITKRTEKWLMESGSDVSADVLKIAHHGSNSSSSSRFLKAVGARYAVISAGSGNRHNHPSHKTLERIKSSGLKVFRTDLDGEVIMKTDGETIEWTSYEKR